MKSLHLTKFIHITLIAALLLSISTQLSFADVSGAATENVGETENVEQEVEVVDAVVGEFERYTPCNEINIPMSKLSNELIVGKLTGKYTDVSTVIVWTIDELNDSDKDIAKKSIVNIPGIGNPKSYEFHSGAHVSLPNYGFTVNASDAKVLMDNPSCWALFAGAPFTKGYITVKEPPVNKDDTLEELAPTEETINPLPDNQNKPTEQPYEEIVESSGDSNIIVPAIIDDNEKDIDKNIKPSNYKKEGNKHNSLNSNNYKTGSSYFPDTGDNTSLLIYVGIIIIASISLLLLKRTPNRE